MWVYLNLAGYLAGYLAGCMRELSQLTLEWRPFEVILVAFLWGFATFFVYCQVDALKLN